MSKFSSSRIRVRQKLELHLTRDLKLGLDTLLFDDLLEQTDLFDYYRDLRREHLKQFEVVRRICVDPVAFKIEDTDHLIIRNDRRDHLGPCPVAGLKISRIFADVGRDDRLAALSNAADKALAQLVCAARQAQS